MLSLMPIPGQIEFNLTELVIAVGVSGGIGILITYAVVVIAVNESKKGLKASDADVQQQQAITKMFMSNNAKVMELQGDIATQNEKFIKLTEERNKDREEYHSLRQANRDLEHTVQTLQSTVKRQGQQIAKLEKDLETEKAENKNLRNQNTKLLDKDMQQEIKLARLSTENILLRKQNDEYRMWQGKANTIPIPDIEIEENEDGELITPIIKQNTNSGIAGDNQSPDNQNPQNSDDNDQTNQEKKPA